jgi:hypothetical protein
MASDTKPHKPQHSARIQIIAVSILSIAGVINESATRKTSEGMKINSTERPREIQKTVLNLERAELGASRVADAVFAFEDQSNEGTT